KAAGALDQFFFGSGPRGFDGAENTAAAGRDLGVLGPLTAQRELVRPPARKGRMRVAVDETGDDRCAAGVDGRSGAQLGGQVSGAAGKQNAASVVPGEGGFR